MKLSRRAILKAIASGVIGYGLDLDLDRLLWVPGEKTIFIPPVLPTTRLSDIVAIEMERVIPRLINIFERDDTFYKVLSRDE